MANLHLQGRDSERAACSLGDQVKRKSIRTQPFEFLHILLERGVARWQTPLVTPPTCNSWNLPSPVHQRRELDVHNQGHQVSAEAARPLTQDARSLGFLTKSRQG